MDENELKATIGETAFNAMSAEQRTALLGKVVPPKAEPPKKEPDPKPDPKDDPSLADKARLERERQEKETGRSRKLESAIKFDLQAKDFLKKHESLLPKEVGDIFAQADKEKFADAIEKDQAIKAGMVTSFFNVQSNVELLTGGQKAALDEWRNLIKTEKQEQAQKIYEMVFEPAFETLKRMKKADALAKGHATDDGDAYKNRIMAGSSKHYLGEKK